MRLETQTLFSFLPISLSNQMPRELSQSSYANLSYFTTPAAMSTLQYGQWLKDVTHRILTFSNTSRDDYKSLRVLIVKAYKFFCMLGLFYSCVSHFLWMCYN